MRTRFLFTLIIVVSINLFSNENILQGERFGISESRKGYLNYIIYNDLNQEKYLLDSGIYLNSRIYIKDGDKRFFLRNNSEYKITVTDVDYRIKWRNDKIEIEEKYSLVDTGYLYTISILNKSPNIKNIGLFLTYDTILGEESGNHFLIDDYKIINRERAYKSSEIPLSIKSIDKLNEGLEFRVMDISGMEPDQVILGNWDRLAFSKLWPYTPKEDGLFSYGYYSINDSGIGIFFNGTNIKPGDTLTKSFKMNFIVAEPVADIKANEPSDEKEWKKTPDVITEPEPEIVPEILPDVSPELETETETTPVIIPDVNSEPEPILDPEAEELKKMLEYIQKKKRGEDVSEYDFDEKYIIEKLKERND
ncbi:MAG: hypothetical protein JXR64_04540 [Spirochaetales bacterium]|nr:hypothetical protein [Spirochaetales bacterium]